MKKILSAVFSLVLAACMSMPSFSLKSVYYNGYDKRYEGALTAIASVNTSDWKYVGVYKDNVGNRVNFVFIYSNAPVIDVGESIFVVTTTHASLNSTTYTLDKKYTGIVTSIVWSGNTPTCTLKYGDYQIALDTHFVEVSTCEVAGLDESKHSASAFWWAYIYSGLPDLTRLRALVTQAENMTDIGYYPHLWSDLQNVLADAKDFLARSYHIQSQVDDMCGRLQAAMNALELRPPPADTSRLEALILQVNSMNQSDYTETSWTALQAALTDANALLTDSNKTQSQVDNMCDRLEAAINALTLKPPPVDTSRLQTLISQASCMNASDYTDASWTALQAALDAAVSLLADIGKLQVEVDGICDWLEAAISALELKPPPLPDTTELRETLVEAKAVEDVGYTVSTWSMLQTAIYQGDALLIRPTYTAIEVQTATTNLRQGISGLVLASAVVNPGNHRYLVDGFRVEDLLPAQTAIMENMGEARKFGLFVFGVLIALRAVIKAVKRFLSFDVSGDSRRDDMHGRKGGNA